LSSAIKSETHSKRLLIGSQRPEELAAAISQAKPAREEVE
jgi:hypothetical protein